MGNSIWLRLQQPQQQCYPVLRGHAVSFRVSVIHRTLEFTTGSLTCVRDHSYACVYIQGVGRTDSESAQHFWLGKTHMFCLCSGRGSNSGHGIHWILSPNALPIEPPRHYRWITHFACGNSTIDDTRGQGKKPKTTDEDTAPRVKAMIDKDCQNTYNHLGDDQTRITIQEMTKHV